MRSGLLLLLVVTTMACDAPPPGASQLDLGPPGLLDLSTTTDGGPVSQRPDGGPILPRADDTYVLPYLGTTEEHEMTISAQPGRLDIHFSVDTTGSFGGEIDEMQRRLEDGIVPAIRARVADAAFGVSRFEDFPVGDFGAASDSPFALLTPITTSVSAIAGGVAALDTPLGQGNDSPESGFEALYQIATGAGYAHDGVTYIPAFDGPGLGGVGFRDGALHTVVHITDAPSHPPSDYDPRLPGTRGLTDVINAFTTLPGFVIGLSGNPAARFDLEPIAIATGAVVEPEGGVCATGLGGASRPPVGDVCPLVFDISDDGTGLSDTIIDALVGLVDTLSFDAVYGETGEDRFGFVRAIVPDEAEVPAGVTPPTITDERPVDGTDDTFRDVRAGADLTFAVQLRNVVLPELDFEQVFRVEVSIVGDGVVLAEETLRIVVPAAVPDAGVPTDMGVAGPTDAGTMVDGGMNDDLGLPLDGGP